ncbi:MAG: alpha/beta fold hydrolase [Ilumatobacteraceae bacterium]
MQLAHELVGKVSDPALVLVHGITESRHMWHPLVHRLAEHHLVLAVDLRGHGDSDRCDPYDPISYAQDVVETVQGLGIEQPLLVGHSLGGVVVSAYAAIAPCVGVVNVDQPLRLADFQGLLQQLEPMLAGSQEEFEGAISMVFDAMNGPLPADEVARISALRGHPRQDVVLGTWDAVLHSTPEELDATVVALAGAITVPYLSLHGIDPGPDYAAWLTGLVPSATVEVWTDDGVGLGHYPQLVQPDRFLARLAEFEAQVRA